MGVKSNGSLRMIVILVLLIFQTKPQCQACVYVFECQICYNNCTTIQSQMFKKCEQTICSSDSGCEETKVLNQAQCFPTCCAQDSNKFSVQQLNTCQDQSKKLSKGAIIGISIGAFIFITMIYGFLYLWWHFKPRQCCCHCYICQSLWACLCCDCLKKGGRNQRQIERMGSSSQIFINQAQEKHLSLQSWQQLQVPNPKISDLNNSCSICLATNVESVTKCGHCFHLQCILGWFKLNPHCPLCKSEDAKYLEFYCRKCLIRYVKVDLKLVKDYSNVMSQIKGPNCRTCQ